MRRLVTAAILGLVVALAITSIADSAPAVVVAKKKPKKCFKKKHGKRVRVKCPKKKPKPKTTHPAPAPPAPAPMTDPVAIGALRSVVAGQMLHRFATSAFPGDEKLYVCGDGSYAYLATL